MRGEPGPDAEAEGGADVRAQAILLRPPRRLGQQQGCQVSLSFFFSTYHVAEHYRFDLYWRIRLNITFIYERYDCTEIG